MYYSVPGPLYMYMYDPGNNNIIHPEYESSINTISHFANFREDTVVYMTLLGDFKVVSLD